MNNQNQHYLQDLKNKLVEEFLKTGRIRKSGEKFGIPKSTASDWIAEAGAIYDPIAAMKLALQAEQKKSSIGKKILVIPDVQAKPGNCFKYLEAAGNYIVEKRPDVIVQIGDFADMPSLSSYDKGKKSAENKRVKKDIEAAQEAMRSLMAPIQRCKGYSPELHLTLGNHEDRIDRFVDANAELEGFLSMDSLGFKEFGWTVHDFKKVLMIDGIAFSHYFYQPNSGRPHGGTAASKLKNIGISFVMGHQQGFDFACRELATGIKQFGLVAGSFYEHEEGYRGPQANGHWHGMVMLHEVKNGSANICQVSLELLKQRYL